MSRKDDIGALWRLARGPLAYPFLPHTHAARCKWTVYTEQNKTTCNAWVKSV